MTTDLDAAYHALKATEEDLDAISTDVELVRREAADALAKAFTANLWVRSGGDPLEYRRLYNELAPKAMVMITAVVGVVREMASGDANEQLDAFLDGVVRGKA